MNDDMTSTAAAPTSLSFPRATFAKLSPRPFLLAHLQPTSSSTPIVRPNGRGVSEFRAASVHTGSLNHTEGSAVVRCGNTAVVCGIKAEILLASDVPRTISAQERPERQQDNDIQSKSLLVPNVELSTGCTPAHLPGQPPSPLAQTLAVRILSLLHSSRMVPDENLRIWHQPLPATTTSSSAVTDLPPKELKAYWTLYIDLLFLSLDGNPFDAAWMAVCGALADVRLPRTKWDVDREMVLCDDDPTWARPLRLRTAPVALTLSVFTTRQPGKRVTRDRKGEKTESDWILADPDAFEEELCAETVTVTVDESADGATPKILKLEKAGGGVVSKEHLRDIVRLAQERWRQWQQVLHAEINKA